MGNTLIPRAAISNYTHVVAWTMSGGAAFELGSELSRLPLEHIDHVELSLRRVSELDVSGIASLVRVFSQLSSQGKGLVLSDVAPAVHCTLKRVGLTAVLTVAPSPAVA